MVEMTIVHSVEHPVTDQGMLKPPAQRGLTHWRFETFRPPGTTDSQCRCCSILQHCNTVVKGMYHRSKKNDPVSNRFLKNGRRTWFSSTQIESGEHMGFEVETPDYERERDSGVWGREDTGYRGRSGNWHGSTHRTSRYRLRKVDRRRGGGVEPTSGGRGGAGPTWRGRPGSTGSHRFRGVMDKSGGTILVGAPKWGSTEVDPPRSASSGYWGAP